MHYATHLFPVIGHAWAVEQLALALNSGRMRQSYLIGGPANIGKTRLARAVAMALNCTSDDARPCGECRACTLISADKHPDVSYVESEHRGATLKIESIREMQRVLMLRPYEARNRIVIVRRFHEASNNAPDALLKTLEEPPGNAVLILTTENPNAIPATIFSRCQPYLLQPLRIKHVQQALEEVRGVPPDEAELLARLSGGRIGWALQVTLDDTILTQRAERLDLLETLLAGKRRDRFDLAQNLSKDKLALFETLQLWQAFWRDALLLLYGSDQWLSNIDRNDTLHTLAQAHSGESLAKALRATQRTVNFLHRNVNPRLALETMLLDYPFNSGANL